MKRFKKVFLALLTPLLLAGCKSSESPLKRWMGEDKKLRVLTTTAQVGSLVSEIGKERVNLWVLIDKELDPHSYEIVKGDLEKFQTADLIFYNGLGLEHGASLSSILSSSSKTRALGDYVYQNYPQEILYQESVVDPHIWMDISLWEKGVDYIVQELSAIDPEGAFFYRENGKELSLKMAKADEELLQAMQKIPSHKRYLVTSHDAFHYFTRRYLADPFEKNWADRFRAPEGLAPEGQLNSQDIQMIINFLKEKQIHVIFPESNVSKDAIRKIASAGKELGLDISVCTEPLYGDAMGGLGYFEMMEKNKETIAGHLWNVQ